MYVGKQYTATVRKGFELEYRCKHCGFTSDTTVIGVGMGKGNSPYFLDGEGARSRAAQSAGSDARTNAELTLKLCPCPKCRKRDAAGFIASSAFAMVGSAGFVWGVGWLIGSIKGRMDDAILWIFGLLGLAMPVILFFTMVQWKWTTAEGRVIFHPLGKPRDAEGEDGDDDEDDDGEGADDDGEEVRAPKKSTPRRRRGGRRTPRGG
jgi:hypothetical protein